MPVDKSAAAAVVSMAAGSPASRREYLKDVLRTLWPPPAQITWSGWLAPPAAGAAELIVLPGGRRPVVLIPRRPRRAAASALRHYKASAGTGDRVRLRAAALAARVGLMDVVGDRVSIRGGAGGTGQAACDIAAYLRGALGRDAVFSLRIGPARANRKPVLLALAPDGEPLGFVKAGISPLTRELVRAEASALGLLAGVPLARLRPPRLLHHGPWQGHEVLVQEAFAGGRPATDHTEVAGAMAELASVRGVRRSRVTASPYWAGLRSRLAVLSHRAFAKALAQALDRLETAAGDAVLAFGSWHGDWTPWNMTMAGGRALVWDWERFGTGVPVGYDAAHYWLQGAIVRGGTPALAAARQALATAVDLVGPLGVEPAHARLVVTLYLIEIGARYSRDGQAEAGAKLGHIDTWLLPALAGEG